MQGPTQINLERFLAKYEKLEATEKESLTADTLRNDLHLSVINADPHDYCNACSLVV
jgi:hypothetical protein